jgi:hypothetical protein
MLKLFIDPLKTILELGSRSIEKVIVTFNTFRGGRGFASDQVRKRISIVARS